MFIPFTYPDTSAYYDLLVSYHINDLWLVFRYEGFSRQNDAETLEFCPTDLHLDNESGRDFKTVAILIHPGDELDAKKSLRDMMGNPFSGSLFKPFDVATGEDAAAFYKKILAKACFTSKVSLWGVRPGGDRVITSTPARP
jgi:hypothetical protein